MTEAQEFLAEPEAKELLHTFIGDVAAMGEVTSYDEVLGIVNNTQLPLAIGSIVNHHGIPNLRVPGQIAISTKERGWKFAAFNKNRENYNGTTVMQSRRRHIIGRERSLVMFHNYALKGAMALEDTVNFPDYHSVYYIDNANPDIQAQWEAIGNVPLYIDFGNSDIASRVTTPVIMAMEARDRAEQTVRSFADISSKLVNQLLRVI